MCARVALCRLILSLVAISWLPGAELFAVGATLDHDAQHHGGYETCTSTARQHVEPARPLREHESPCRLCQAGSPLSAAALERSSEVVPPRDGARDLGACDASIVAAPALYPKPCRGPPQLESIGPSA